jgi:hypothetical protein
MPMQETGTRPKRGLEMKTPRTTVGANARKIAAFRDCGTS